LQRYCVRRPVESSAALLIIVASLLAPFAVGALWADRTITETDTFVEPWRPLQTTQPSSRRSRPRSPTALIDAIDAKTRVSEALSS